MKIVALDHIVLTTGDLTACLRDPDGNLVELCHYA